MELDRRRFLGLTAATTVGLLAEACAPKITPQSQNEAGRPTNQAVSSSETRLASEEPRTRMLQEINALPESSTKKALQARINPLVASATPQLVVAGVDLPISRVSIKEAVTANAAPTSNIHATYTKRGVVSPTVYKPVSEYTMSIPLLHTIRSNEIAQIPPQNFLSDGTPFVTVEWTPDTSIDKNLAPEIVVNINVNGASLNPTAIQTLKTFGYIKEASGFLIDILNMEATIQEMQKYNLPTHVDAKDPAGNVSSIPILTEAALNLFHNNGRSKALLDLAGYVVGIKAIAKTPAYQILVQADIIDAGLGNLVANADIGSTEQDIFVKSYEFVLSHPEVERFEHQGNINIFP